MHQAVLTVLVLAVAYFIVGPLVSAADSTPLPPPMVVTGASCAIASPRNIAELTSDVLARAMHRRSDQRGGNGRQGHSLLYRGRSGAPQQARRLLVSRVAHIAARDCSQSLCVLSNLCDYGTVCIRCFSLCCVFVCGFFRLLLFAVPTS